MPKFMQTLDEEIYKQLSEMANERGINIQELIRAVVVPDWLKRKKEEECTSKLGKARLGETALGQ